jgi:hypothetical protein
MLPVFLIFTSGVASGVNSYAAVLVLGLLGRFGHIAAIPPVLERPSVTLDAGGLGAARDPGDAATSGDGLFGSSACPQLRDRQRLPRPRRALRRTPLPW